MGRTPTATEIVKDPKWLQSDVAEAAARRCKIGFRTDWDYHQSLGARPPLFYPLPYHKRHEAARLETLLKCKLEVAMLTEAEGRPGRRCCLNQLAPGIAPARSKGDGGRRFALPTSTRAFGHNTPGLLTSSHGVAFLTPPMSRANRLFVFTDHVAFLASD